MLDKDLKLHVKITTEDEKEQFRIGNYIHFQLIGKPDYIDNRIILNIDTDNEINLYIYKDCKEIPNIVI